MGATVNRSIFPREHMRKTRVIAFRMVQCIIHGVTCSLIVPNVPQPETMITKGGEIIEKDTGAPEQGRLFRGLDFTYLGVLGS